MVDKTSKVAHLSLKDLVCARPSTPYHHIDALDAVCDEAGEFTDSGASFNILGVLALVMLEWSRDLHSER